MRSLLVVAFALLLGACSTSVEHKTPAAPDVIGNIAVTDVAVTAHQAVDYAAPAMLRAAILKEIAARAPGRRPVSLAVTIENLDVKSGGARFMIGAFGGANTMRATVVATEQNGQSVADFRIVRESNPGGYGAFYDQKQATIGETAKGIVDTLYGPAE